MGYRHSPDEILEAAVLQAAADFTKVDWTAPAR